ncbi:MAG: hydrogenase nickel incorporation protein HypB [Hydrogenophaga sp.]|uniref:hydrogenase nickel incorporation protein HypB n=1 Tax=Hydrogenophaga sp. TaxID=1904254 RepID=UPI001DBE6BF4|nr:hydrogenase nickel incorporation protein HypB [Hydrogenophaga sp.]MBX3609053.1 hydrogenase nickel incorporation protein HypB [Hydrogenophaga sp.]
MCVVCGCSETGAGQPAHHTHHAHHPQPGEQAGELHFGAGAARVSVPGLSQERALRIETDILGANDRVARDNRVHFAAHGVTALNLVSSPGSGKTTLLCATIDALRQRDPQRPVMVIEGDQQTSFDAERIRATGAPAIQVNTGKGCHLDAPMVAEAFARLHEHGDGHGHPHTHSHSHAHAGALLFIENVGNLVCPAVWDLGEAAKVAVLSVTEGEDKPLKYPDMFAAARLMVLNKIDLLPHVRFDVARCVALARRVNPAIEVIQLSATTGEGMDAWLHWLDHASGHAHDHGHDHAHDHAPAEARALRERVQQLERELAQAQQALSAQGHAA